MFAFFYLVKGRAARGTRNSREEIRRVAARRGGGFTQHAPVVVPLGVPYVVEKGVWITCRPMSSPLTSVAGIKTHPRTPASRVPVRATTPTPTRFLSRIASTIAVNAAVDLLVCGFCEPASAVDAAAPPPRYADPLLPPAPASPLGRINRAGRFVVCHRKRSSVSACVFSRNP